MLKTRVMPTLLFDRVGLVKGVAFDAWRRVGSAMQAVKVYNMRQVDELVFLDINATRTGEGPDLQTIDELADECFMPMTVGGGVRDINDVRNLLKVGADKVAINTSAIHNPKLITQAADRFGAQCIVVSIDFKQHDDGSYEVFTTSGTKATGLDPVQVAIDAQASGAGEILLTSIGRDGTMTGYDVALTQQVCEQVTIPVIASGGAGEYSHMLEVIKQGGASAVAAASMFHYTQYTPLEAKAFLKENGVAIRM